MDEREEYGRRGVGGGRIKETTEQNEKILSNDEGEEKERRTTKRGSQLVSYSNGEPSVNQNDKKGER